MQIRSPQLSELRKQLLGIYHPNLDALAPFLASHPLMKGTVYTLRRKCSKPSCRCARGFLHATVVLTASIKGKTRLWTIPENRMKEVRQKTQHYRQFHKARARLVKDFAKMMRLIDAIEKSRTKGDEPW